MLKQSILSQVSVSELQHMRDEGYSNKEIAKRLDVSEASISKLLPSQRKKAVTLSVQDRKDIVELHQSGISVKEIAEEYGCSLGAVYSCLKQGGVQIRKKKETKKSTMTPTPKQEEPPKTSRLTRLEIGVFTGRCGRYLVNMEDKSIMLPSVPETINKEQLGYFIRDLMTIYQEV